jgi:hypothetical protein
MGNIHRCMYCKDVGTENSPILEIHSRGKYRGKFICFNCIKKKVELILEFERIIQQGTNDCE